MDVYIKNIPKSNTFTEKCLQILAVTATYSFLYLIFPMAFAIPIYLIFFTKFWPICIIYLIWIPLDQRVTEEGGRLLKWTINYIVWKYMVDYFPVSLICDGKIDLDPKKNYLFCSFPHGLICTGAWLCFKSSYCGSGYVFPNHKLYGFTVSQLFYLPIAREFALWCGLSKATARSINWILSSPNGGNIAILVVGGASEVFYSRPGQYTLVLRKRRGFIKIALKNGSPLVPVFSFGENDIFDQVNTAKVPLLGYLQTLIKKTIGAAAVIPIGRGNLPMVPFRTPINTVVGKPIDVVKIEDPTEEQINALHGIFVKELMDLFEKYKFKYAKNPEKTHLVLI